MGETQHLAVGGGRRIRARDSDACQTPADVRSRPGFLFARFCLLDTFSLILWVLPFFFPIRSSIISSSISRF